MLVNITIHIRNTALKINLKNIVKQIEIALSARKIAISPFPKEVQPYPSATD